MSCQDLSIMPVQQLLLPLFCFREFHFSTLQSKLKQNVLWAQEVIIGKKSSCLLLLHFILFYFILFLISNENIIKLSKKSDTQVYSKYTLGTRATNTQITSIYQRMNPKKLNDSLLLTTNPINIGRNFLAIYLFGM